MNDDDGGDGGAMDEGDPDCLDHSWIFFQDWDKKRKEMLPRPSLLSPSWAPPTSPAAPWGYPWTGQPACSQDPGTWRCCWRSWWAPRRRVAPWRLRTQPDKGKRKRTWVLDSWNSIQGFSAASCWSCLGFGLYSRMIFLFLFAQYSKTMYLHICQDQVS